uniref:FYVE, RhoGEF and PH domain containing 5 n=1 Tax=Leptobrachium leishanense TaxID=445787 RepID=A0A8C5QP27_9ANUR
MSADITKPALAPKPQGLDGFGLAPLTRCSSSLISKAGRAQRRSASRGPKPPIAPKPVLSPATERKCMEDTNNSLNKCPNGESSPPTNEILYTEDYSLDCSEPHAVAMTYEDYITAPGSKFTNSGNTNSEYENLSGVPAEPWEAPPADGELNDDMSCGPSGAGEEDSGHPESAPLGDLESGDSTEVEDSDNTDALSLRSSSTAEADSLAPHCGCDTLQFKNDFGNMEDFLPSDINEDSMEHEDIERDMKTAGCPDVILTDVSLDDLPIVEETRQEENTECSKSRVDVLCDDYSAESCDATEESAVGDLEVTSSLQVQCDEEVETGIIAETMVEAKKIAEEEQDSCKLNEAPLTDSNNAEEAEPPESRDPESSEAPQGEPEVDEDHEDTAEDLEEEDNAEDSCQIIPFEKEINEDAEASEDVISEVTTESDTELRGERLCQEVQCDQEIELCRTESPSEVPRTSVATEGSYAWPEDPSGLTHGEVIEGDGADTTEMSPENQESEVKEPLIESTEGMLKPELATEAEEEDDTNPYVLEDSVQSRNRKLLSTEDSVQEQVAEEATGSHCMMVECDFEEESHLLSIDRKNIVTRTRSYSGKIPGNVPETVPEETSADIDSQTSTCESQVHHSGDKPETKTCRSLPRKPGRFILYPRSYSVEGRENTVSLYLESDVSNFSPYVITSSGSFSQKNHHSSSGMSTPSSVVDIPPPFELASITKKPITKSSPSLLIENEASEKSFKKKKSSFKRFLTLKFKKKTENKVHVDVNASSSRSSSESSYQGSLRLMDLDRRSLSNSPQLPSRSGMPYCPDSPSAILFYKDMKRKGTSKAFNRSVARVESFEDRSRPPFMPLPLTKPRSISFPNADTSDYENIPTMSSDYENIQIPPNRPGRAGTFTEFFDDPCRALSSANENDGYVDMSSFNTLEAKPQAKDQEAERAQRFPLHEMAIYVSRKTWLIGRL